MKKDRLKQLAADPKYIPGIYNYCDRWCERCQFTSRCMNFTLSEEEFGGLEDQDLHNEAFWQRLSEVFHSTLEMVREMAEEMGVDMDAMDIEEYGAGENGSVIHIISHMSRAYADLADDWFDANEYMFLDMEDEFSARPADELSEQGLFENIVDLEDAIQVVRWYQYQIHVKLRRALSSQQEEMDEEDDFPSDADGSAKVALIGMDRSISAWGRMLKYMPDHKEGLVKLVAVLDNLRQRSENAFPNARDFVRPGFDETRRNS